MAEKDWFQGFTKSVARTQNGMVALVYDVIPNLGDQERQECAQFAIIWRIDLSTKCRHCGQPIDREDADTIQAYWNHTDDVPMQFLVHTACRQNCKEQEAFDCQSIDRDCNDCLHFQRGKNVPEGVDTHLNGWCSKLNKSVKANPNFASLLPCFEHRRAAYFAETGEPNS